MARGLLPQGIVGRVLLLLSPGQGAQTPGLLTPWLDVPDALASLERWSSATGLDLLRLGTTADRDELRATEVAQPLLVATALLSARALDLRPDLVCGHSVGELAALALAGVIDDDTAVLVAARRGKAMARAAALSPTGMVAVLGGDEATVRATAAEADLEVSTVNGPGQLVLGGPTAALQDLVVPGSKLRHLDVAGAFHTAAMSSARTDLATVVADLEPHDARCPVVANADGAALTDGRELLQRLVDQLTGPVRFDRCVEQWRAMGVTSVVELAPGGTLAGVVRRALPDVAVIALKDRADVAEAQALQGVPA